MSNNSQRSYSFSLVCYAPITDLKRVALEKCRHFAIAEHDSDILEDGTPKQKHVHLLVVMKNAMTLTAVRRLFALNGENALAQNMGDKYACFRYLTHADNPEKFQYSADIVYTNNASYWNDCANDVDDKNETLLGMLDELRGKHNLRDMVRRYGRDFVLHYQSYKAFAETLDYEEAIEEKRQANCVRMFPVSLGNSNVVFAEETPAERFVSANSNLF